MEQPAIDERLVRRYLLGELAEEEREGLEQRLLTDDGFYETFAALEEVVEDELIDQYADGELTDAEHESFTRLLESNLERAEKLRLVRDLREHVVPVAVSEDSARAGRDMRHRTGRPRLFAFNVFQNPLVGLSCAAALLLAVLCGVWLLIKSNRLETELRQLRAREQYTPNRDPGLQRELGALRARNEELTNSLRRSEEQRAGLEQQVASLKTSPRQPPVPPGGANPREPRAAIFSLILSPTRRGAAAGEGVKVLTLPPGAARARLVLGVEGIDPKDFQSYEAVVESRAGATVWRASKLSVRVRRGRGQVVLLLPAELLPEGQYLVELNGVSSDGTVEPVGSYSFQVKTK